MTAKRNADLACIHIAAKQIGMDKRHYRALLMERYGRDTAANLDDSQRADLISELVRRGARIGRGNRKEKPADTPMCAREQRAYLDDLLAKAGLTETYVTSMAKRMYQVDSTRWLTAQQLGAIVAALRRHIGRSKGKARP
jgi:phage gp16-like protein